LSQSGLTVPAYAGSLARTLGLAGGSVASAEDTRVHRLLVVYFYARLTARSPRQGRCNKSGLRRAKRTPSTLVRWRNAHTNGVCAPRAKQPRMSTSRTTIGAPAPAAAQCSQVPQSRKRRRACAVARATSLQPRAFATIARAQGSVGPCIKAHATSHLGLPFPGQRFRRGLTPRSKGPATAGFVRPACGTPYIVTSRPYKPCLRGPLSSNVRPRSPSRNVLRGRLRLHRHFFVFVEARLRARNQHEQGLLRRASVNKSRSLQAW
jgi:hypothetical protein